MGCYLNRAEKRRLARCGKIEQLTKRFNDARDEVSSVYLSLPVATLYREYGWSAEQCNEFNIKLVELYNTTNNCRKFQRDFYRETGIGVMEEMDGIQINNSASTDNEEESSADT